MVGGDRVGGEKGGLSVGRPVKGMLPVREILLIVRSTRGPKRTGGTGKDMR